MFGAGTGINQPSIAAEHAEGAKVPDHFGRDEVLAILGEYYKGLTEKVEIKLHGAATGDTKK